MSIKRWGTKRDASEGDIVSALEAVGAQVWQLDFPVDLLVWFRARWFLMEVKTGKGAVRKSQVAQRNFIATTGCPIVRSSTEALRAIGASDG